MAFTKLDAAQVEQEARDEIERRTVKLALYEQVIEVLKTFEGKRINKRIETAVKLALPEYTVVYQRSITRHELLIWGQGISYERKLDLSLGYYNDKSKYPGLGGGDTIFTMELLWKMNPWLPLERNRINKAREQLLALAPIVAAFNLVLDDLNRVREDAAKTEFRLDYKFQKVLGTR